MKEHQRIHSQRQPSQPAPQSLGEKKHILPRELQKYTDQLMNTFIGWEKEGYDNKLVPFSQQAEQMKAKGEEFAYAMWSRLKKGQEVLKREMDSEEEKNPNFPTESSFSCWERAARSFRKKMQSPGFSDEELDPEHSLKKQCGMSDAFMQRAYEVAVRLMSEKKFEEAGDIFMFLRYLDSAVYEYWLGEATCLQELYSWAAAIDAYSMSLFLKPQNPYVFFQIANCMYQLKEFETSLAAIRICIRDAQQDEQRADLFKQATEVQHTLELELQKVI